MGWSLVAGQTASAAGSGAATFTNTPATGNLVVACFCPAGVSPTGVGVTDGNSVALTQAVGTTTGNSAGEAYIFYYAVPASASKSFTPAGSLGGAGIFIAEYTCGQTISTGTVLETTGVGGGTNNTVNAPSINPSNSGDLGISCISYNGNFSAFTTWIQISSSQNGNAAGYIIDTASQTFTANSTSTGTTGWDSAMALFKLPSAAGPSTIAFNKQGGIIRRPMVITCRPRRGLLRRPPIVRAPAELVL
jgi:hypothetical protein